MPFFLPCPYMEGGGLVYKRQLGRTEGNIVLLFQLTEIDKDIAAQARSTGLLTENVLSMKNYNESNNQI